MKILALDIGRSRVKGYDGQRTDEFESVIGEDYRELKDANLGPREIILSFEGKQYFGGALAARESEYPIQDSRSSKLHNTTRLLAVMGMHRMVQNGDKIALMTGYPIGKLNNDVRAKVRELLTGGYTAVVNGVKKSWIVERIEVLPEGAVAAWGVNDFPELASIIDAGSRTTNYAVLLKRGLFDRLSNTIDMGCETVRNMSSSLFADAIAAQLSRRWLQQYGPLYVTGGKADELAKEFARHYEDVRVLGSHASAIGMYKAGVKKIGATQKSEHVASE